MYMGKRLLYILAFADIQKIHAESGTTTKQLILEVERVIERKRLTTNEKYPHGAEGVSENKLTGRYCRGVFEATACVEKLAEYETAEEEGRLVVLPCDTVYFIWNKSSGISHVRAKSILDLSLREILGIDKDGRYWSAKEEAEKALEEMKKNE